ncbi:NPCBM/NEW2 domain-containing protein [Streptomyces sp. NPDC048193]|uniref:NPCBM/NEW2 domain-containing protein n=1 Tax=unclassified Streptomyces TaxID=2593676 RepID=UPI00342A96BC
MVGLLLGFFGLPTVVDSPTAQSAAATATVTATATATVTAAAEQPGADADASAEPSAALPTGDVPLTDLTPLSGMYTNWELKPVVLGGRRFDNALTTEPGWFESVGWSINEHYKSLTVTVGLDDNSAAYPVTVAFKAGADGEKTLKTATAQINRPVQVTVDLTGVAILHIEAVQSDNESATLALGDAMLHSS